MPWKLKLMSYNAQKFLHTESRKVLLVEILSNGIFEMDKLYVEAKLRLHFYMIYSD